MNRIKELFIYLKKTKTASDRSFGLFFSSVLGLLAIYLFLYKGSLLFISVALLSLLFLLSSLLVPKILFPFNLIWTFLGIILGTIFRPIIIGLIFFLLITPTALVIKLIGRDELSIKRPSKKTYWKKKEESALDLDFFKNQF